MAGVGVGKLVGPREPKARVAGKMGVIFVVAVGVGVPLIEALIAATQVAATSTVGSSLTSGLGEVIVLAAGDRAEVRDTICVGVDSATMQAVDNRTEASLNTITDRRENRASQPPTVLHLAPGST